MCGRYFLDGKSIQEIRKIVRYINTKPQENIKVGEVYPTNKAPVLFADNNEIKLDSFIWGFPNYKSKGVMINARSETTMEKRTFQESILNRRCIIPANGFYEWDKTKNKFYFKIKESPVLFMAGIYNNYNGENRFVILTTNANESIVDVHSRMPLILKPSELETWIFNNNMTSTILHEVPPLLERESGNIQLRLDIF